MIGQFMFEHRIKELQSLALMNLSFFELLPRLLEIAVHFGQCTVLTPLLALHLASILLITYKNMHILMKHKCLLTLANRSAFLLCSISILRRLSISPPPTIPDILSPPIPPDWNLSASRLRDSNSCCLHWRTCHYESVKHWYVLVPNDT